ncbi:malonyl-ACP O-methyltransferase BioC [Shimazuella sp. AN120528]|uniref:malonyl-ACP O-methyltransferase BioC n=1 Tax=Shimazuella soli TaxID=1892854 RepID=UPI001F0EC582|nr:malonyl-ACP O-methyltransferase BioC [Shimazuella soli]MCH5585218.1 malonyl-ACP O-methyltransferase BioC [Shimazuella soli]
MRVNKSLVARRFDRSSSTYDQYAVIQKQIAHRLLQTLDKCNQPIRRICEIGCGTGYLTNLLIQKYPDAELTAIDLAPKMIETAKRNIPHPNIHWHTGDAEDVHAYLSGKYDLIISNATIQWLSNSKETIMSWGKALQPNGVLLASTFGIDTFQELTNLFQKLEKKQADQHHLTMHPSTFWKKLWELAGLTSVNVQENREKVSYSNCRSFLRNIKATGANYSVSQSSSLANHLLLKNVMEEYDRLYREENGVYATYHVIHLYGQKTSE